MSNNVRLREAVTTVLSAVESNGDRLTVSKLNDALEEIGHGKSMWVPMEANFIMCAFCGHPVDETSMCETARHEEREVMNIQRLVRARRAWRGNK